MVILGIIFLVTVISLTVGFHKHLKYSVSRSTILGLTLAILTITMLMSEALTFVILLGFKAGALLGGVELEELQHRYFQIKANEMLAKSRGDESANEDSKDSDNE